MLETRATALGDKNDNHENGAMHNAIHNAIQSLIFDSFYLLGELSLCCQHLERNMLSYNMMVQSQCLILRISQYYTNLVKPS